jgi:hypothetical protein
MSDTEDDLISYFGSLAAEALAEYRALAERDRLWGEDAASERRAEEAS